MGVPLLAASGATVLPQPTTLPPPGDEAPSASCSTATGTISLKPRKTVKLPPPIIGKDQLQREARRSKLSEALQATRSMTRFLRFASMGVSYQALRQGTEFKPPSPTKARSLTARRRKGSLLEMDALRQEEEERRRWKEMYVADDKWEEATTTVWFPVGPRKRLWDYWMLMVLIYSIIVEPYRIAFNSKVEGYTLWIESLLSIFFLMDIAFTFNTVRRPRVRRPRVRSRLALRERPDSCLVRPDSCLVVRSRTWRTTTTG